MRFLADGSVDPGFTSSGDLRIDWGGPTDAILAVALQPDGKIVAAGRGGPATAGTDVAVARVWP